MLKNFPNFKIFLFEKELIPGGLLRYGVAPDHPEIRNSLENFDEIFSYENFHFINN